MYLLKSGEKDEFKLLDTYWLRRDREEKLTGYSGRE